MYRIVYRPETAMTDDVIEADGVQILSGEGLAVFGATAVEGRYQRQSPIPLRYIHEIRDSRSGQLLFSTSR